MQNSSFFKQSGLFKTELQRPHEIQVPNRPAVTMLKLKSQIQRKIGHCIKNPGHRRFHTKCLNAGCLTSPFCHKGTNDSSWRWIKHVSIFLFVCILLILYTACTKTWLEWVLRQCDLKTEYSTRELYSTEPRISQTVKRHVSYRPIGENHLSV